MSGIQFYRDAEVERLAQGAAGVKRTTGQHPGELWLFQTIWMSMISPVQYPAMI